MSFENYFSIYDTDKPTVAPEKLPPATPRRPSAFFQWLALLLGVIVQPFYAYYKEHEGMVDLGAIYNNPWFIAFAIIVALIAFPAVYRRAFDTDRPNWVQMIPIFTAGIGWQTLVDVAVEVGANASSDPEISYIMNLVSHLPVLCP